MVSRKQDHRQNKELIMAYERIIFQLKMIQNSYAKRMTNNYVSSIKTSNYHVN